MVSVTTKDVTVICRERNAQTVIPIDQIRGVIPLNAMNRRYYYYTCGLCSRNGERVEHFDRLTQPQHEFLAQLNRTICITLPPELLCPRVELPPIAELEALKIEGEIYELPDDDIGHMIESLAEMNDPELAEKVRLLRDRRMGSAQA